MRSGSLSVQTTWWPSSARHVPVTKPTYPQPITEICTYGLLNCGQSNGLACRHHLPAGSLQSSFAQRVRLSAPNHVTESNRGPQIKQSVRVRSRDKENAENGLG